MAEENERTTVMEGPWVVPLIAVSLAQTVRLGGGPSPHTLLAAWGLSGIATVLLVTAWIPIYRNARAGVRSPSVPRWGPSTGAMAHALLGCQLLALGFDL
ncbi:hypothetical protein [Streptomyces albipurpureus]|uniref:Uncharacterized protein n=1 Tax=Streptomyces albipurpureus TaxID=2897419 RepID=A0ABT0UTP6_9ACTN|nr:hypothetical protein [Streptomyces sp. CWNU-1]MCM2391963.1 hypothetical protein [Streptomyces sp. CWNU-1]